MPLNGQQLAAEILAAIGGEQTPARVRAFQALADAVVKHIQMNATVTVQNVTPGVGTVVTPGPGAVT